MPLPRRRSRLGLAVLSGIVAGLLGGSAPTSAGGGTTGTAAWAPARAALLRRDLLAVGGTAPIGDPATLRAALFGDDRVVATAALIALEARGEPWALGELARLAAAPDRRRATSALVAARAVVARLFATGPAGAAAHGLDGAALGELAVRYLAVAKDRRRWSEVRGDGLEVAAGLVELAEQAGAPELRADLERALRELLDDEDPAIGRAAVELLPSPPSAGAIAALAARLAAEPRGPLVGSIAAALCADLGPRHDASSVRARLGSAGLGAVVAYASAVTAVGPSEVELARCLVADQGPPSRAALAQLRAQARGAVRHALESIDRVEPGDRSEPGER